MDLVLPDSQFKTCPDSEWIIKAVSGDLPEPELDLFVEHLAQCSECVARIDHLIDPEIDQPPAVSPGNSQSDPLSIGKAFSQNRWQSFSHFGDRFEVVRLLGQGGMGEVFQCFDTKLNRQIAIKKIRSEMLRPDFVERLEREARIQSGLNHPGVVQVFEAGQWAGIPFIAMEFVAGESLRERLNQSPLAPFLAALLIMHLAKAIDHAHQNQVLHRDLKPSNILLTESFPQDDSGYAISGSLYSTDLPIAKISDFGLAKLLNESDSFTALNVVVGTTAYLSPEQISRPSDQLLPTVDIYALGVLLYECLTGYPPFVGHSKSKTMSMIENVSPVSPRFNRPEVSRDLETICLKCLQKEPEKRYQTALALADDLHRYLQGKTILARPVPVWQKAWRWCRRNSRVALAMAVATVSLFSLSIILFFGAYSQMKLSNQAYHSGRLAILESKLRNQLQVDLNAQRHTSEMKLFEASLILYNITNLLMADTNNGIEAENRLKLANIQLQNGVRDFSRHMMENDESFPSSSALNGFTVFNLARSYQILGEYAKAADQYQKLLNMIDEPAFTGSAHRHYFLVATALALSDLSNQGYRYEQLLSLQERAWQRVVDRLTTNPNPGTVSKISPDEIALANKLFDHYQKNNLNEKAAAIATQIKQFQPGLELGNQRR